jgi:hypothetical protein
MHLSAKQSYVLEVLENNFTTEILIGGGAYGGKSRILCFWLLKLALQYPGARLLLGRNELKRLKETTLVTFLEVAKEQGLKLGVHYRLNLQDNYIHFANGSHMILADLKYEPSDPEFEDLGSLELTAAGIDEASEVTKKVKDILSVRVNRWKNKEFGYLGRVCMSCNPHKGWLFSTYYEPWEKGTLKPYQTFIPMLATDNPWLEPEYLAALQRLPMADRERLLEGNWHYDADPARLIDFNKIQDLWTNTFVPEGIERYITADLAMQGSDVFTIWIWSGFRVKKIFMYDKSTGKEIEHKIREHAEQYGVPRSNIVFDSDGLGEFLGSYLEGAVPFHNGSRPIEREIETDKGVQVLKENYANLKTQTSFELAKKVQANEIYIEDKEYRDKIAAELAWIKRDRMDDDGKLYLLPKKKVKAGLGRSPDFADAMHMRMWFELDRERIRDVSGANSGDRITEHVGGYDRVNDYGVTDGY